MSAKERGGASWLPVIDDPAPTDIHHPDLTPPFDVDIAQKAGVDVPYAGLLVFVSLVRLTSVTICYTTCAAGNPAVCASPKFSSARKSDPWLVAEFLSRGSIFE